MFKSILEFLKSKNINTLFWKHTDFWYPKFSLETIAKDTKFKMIHIAFLVVVPYIYYKYIQYK